MKVKTTTVKSKSVRKLIVGYDISKFKHNYYSSFSDNNLCNEIEGVVLSSRKELNCHFLELRKLAAKHGYSTIVVACEPTGGYEKSFINLARVHGFFVKYVSGEATSKFKVIETNDSGKNDIKDARVIFSLATQEKTLECRELKGVYSRLNQLNRSYERMSLGKSRAKTIFSTILDGFFPSLHVKSSKYYNKTFRCIVDEFKLNPYKIAKLTLDEFEKIIQLAYKRKLSKAAKAIITLVWEKASSYKESEVDLFYIEESEGLIEYYYGQIKSLDKMKEMYKLRMVELYSQTKEYGQLKEVPVSDFLMSRVISEAGPLGDFDCIEKLMRYAGLNLKERCSGTYIGKVKISKKGNVLLRKILGQIAFASFTKKVTDFGQIYHRKKEVRGGHYALTCIMRKSLKMIFGVYRSKEEFQLERMLNQNPIIKEDVA